MFKKLFNVLIFNILVLSAMAQDMNQLVSLQYAAAPLGNVLADISRRYDVRFTYSSDFVPLQYPLSTSQRDVPLSVALDELFEPTPITYKRIAGQLVLRVDRGKKKRLEEEKRMAKQMAMRRRRSQKAVEKLPTKEKVAKLEGGDRILVFNIPQAILEEEPEEEDAAFARVSVFTYHKDWQDLEGKKEARVLIDVVGGSHNYVEGVNIGGGFNNTLHDMKGVQVAGLGNIVNGEVKGTQVAGVFNKVRGDVSGVQSAGAFNLTRGEAKGIQVAGITNIAHKGAKAPQISGILNYSGGDARIQVSGLLNVAGNVKGVQVSPLFNKAKKVEGVQIGLINVADTISGASYGLINVIKRGYNRIELSGNEVLFANVAGKFGSNRFYSVLHLGARWDSPTIEGKNGVYMSWGIGYGFGTTVSLGKRARMNIEAVSIHINELEAWTNELNLLNQLRVTFDRALGKRISIFAGPVLNVFVSKVEADPVKARIQFEPYDFLDKSEGNKSTKMWVGFTGGIRF